MMPVPGDNDVLRLTAELVADRLAETGYAFVEDDQIERLTATLRTFVTAAGIAVNGAANETPGTGGAPRQSHDATAVARIRANFTAEDTPPLGTRSSAGWTDAANSAPTPTVTTDWIFGDGRAMGDGTRTVEKRQTGWYVLGHSVEHLNTGQQESALQRPCVCRGKK